jgi:hypothetical protein
MLLLNLFIVVSECLSNSAGEWKAGFSRMLADSLVYFDCEGKGATTFRAAHLHGLAGDGLQKRLDLQLQRLGSLYRQKATRELR